LILQRLFWKSCYRVVRLKLVMLWGHHELHRHHVRILFKREIRRELKITNKLRALRLRHSKRGLAKQWIVLLKTSVHKIFLGLMLNFFFGGLLATLVIVPLNIFQSEFCRFLNLRNSSFQPHDRLSLLFKIQKGLIFWEIVDKLRGSSKSSTRSSLSQRVYRGDTGCWL
jgi:hypothetical protein